MSAWCSNRLAGVQSVKWFRIYLAFPDTAVYLSTPKSVFFCVRPIIHRSRPQPRQHAHRSPRCRQMATQDVEDQLRSALLQIQKSSAHLPTRQGCTFALHVEAHEEEGARAGRHDVSWINTQKYLRMPQVRRATAVHQRILAGAEGFRFLLPIRIAPGVFSLFSCFDFEGYLLCTKLKARRLKG